MGTEIMRFALGVVLLVLCGAAAFNKDAPENRESDNEHPSYKKDGTEGRKGKRDRRHKPDPLFLKAQEDTWTMWDEAKTGTIDSSKIGETFRNTPAYKHLNLTIHPSTIQLHMDDNLVGKITKREFKDWFKDNDGLKKRVAKDWDKADINEDGFVTLREYFAAPMGRHAKRRAGKKAAEAEFKRMDRSGQGKITKEDFLWYVSSDDFGSADRNGDGFLTLDEYIKAPFHFHDYEEPTVKIVTKEFHEADTNKDGKLSVPEFNEQMKQARAEDQKRDDKDGRDGGDDNDGDHNDDKSHPAAARPHQVKPKKAVTQLNNL